MSRLSRLMIVSVLAAACGSDDTSDTSTSVAGTTSAADDGGSASPTATSPATTTTANDGNVDGNGPPCTGQLEIDTSTLPDAFLGQPYDESVGYTAPDGWELSWGPTDPPPGIEIEVDAGTIRFFGTPSVEGEFQIVFSLFNADGAGCGDSRNVFVNVAAGPGGSDSTGGTASSGGSSTGTGGATTGG